MANKTDTIKQLPAIFQTVVERKFFDSTFDQVFSKKDSERLTGYIGRRIGGSYNPNDDFYLPEPTKDRTWYQLEPISSVLNVDTLARTNQFFYDDLINTIQFYGGNVENHDRLFNSFYYCYSPPIDADKYVNYQNYFWLPDRLPIISVYNVDDTAVETEILGNAQYIAPNGFKFINSIIVNFPDSVSYRDPYTVINVGRSINFIPDYPEILTVKKYNLLPWDSKVSVAGTTVNNNAWGMLPWDAIDSTTTTPDYITMEMGSIDRNAWSRTNKWYHIDTINEVVLATGTSFPNNAVRAQRPILEFFKSIELYGSGSNFVADVNYFLASGTPSEFECNPLVENFNTITFNDVQGTPLSVVKLIPSLSTISAGETLVFPCDSSGAYLLNAEWAAGINNKWDTLNWDSSVILDENGDPVPVKNFVWQVVIRKDSYGVDTVVLVPYISQANVTRASSPAVAEMKDGDIILIVSGRTRFEDPVAGHYGETYYFSNGLWRLAANQKTGNNQPLKFNLYDIEHNSLDSPTYPDSNFRGSEIFSYKVDDEPNAVVDPVLGFPIVYKSLGQTSDIMFENDLQVDRYEYVIDSSIYPIIGYYYYKKITGTDEDIYENSWYSVANFSKQDVIEHYVVIDETDDEFILSVAPYEQSIDNLIVKVDGVPTDKFAYALKNGNPVIKITQKVKKDQAIEVAIYTYDYLTRTDTGYFEIPQQLEANPVNAEVKEQSFGEFSIHFGTIMENQIGFEGSPLGYNNYRNTARDPSLGTKILQNESSLLKSMFVSGNDDLNAIRAIRFAGNDYVNYRAKFLKIATQLWNRGFKPFIQQGDLEPDLWLEEILKVITVSREFSSAFAYSYMLARSDVFSAAEITHTSADEVYTPLPVDLTDPRNAMYLYHVTDAFNNNIYANSQLLVVDVDYNIVDYTTGAFVFKPAGQVQIGDKIAIRVYNDSIPAYLPATPTKLGTTTAQIPAIVLDASYATPVLMIVGHDGSRTPVFGTYDTAASVLRQRLVSLYEDVTQVDIRDVMLLELERRIYNGLNPRFTVDSDVLLRIVDIRPGAFRQTYNPGICKFEPTARNRYTRKEYYNITESYFAKWTAENKADYRQNEFFDPADWRTWNYSSQTDNVLFIGNKLPGHWKGAFRQYYDTVYPATAPWQMLGYDIKPAWWEEEYGPYPWAATNKMWADLEAGIPARGDIKAGQARYSRPGLSRVLPIYADGLPKPLPEIFGITATAWQGMADDWIYGDGSPVEQAWYDSPEYKFSELEFFYLMRPAEFGEKFWNPGQVRYFGYQLLDEVTKERQKNSTLVVHGEVVDNEVTYKSGYQQYITDYLLFLGKDITVDFGDKVRRLDVQLGHKMASFTDKDTMRVRLQSAGAGTSLGGLIIPTDNYQVNLYQGASIADYVYSGVIIRARANGGFSVYGYDLLSQAFKMLPPITNGKQQRVNSGGTPAPFTDFEFNRAYKAGDIVRYNTRFYSSKKDQIATIFNSKDWYKLAALPQTGGQTVIWYQERAADVAIVPYGTTFHNVQDVYDFLIGYGQWLESIGWVYDSINELNQVLDWKNSADQFLFWVSSNWAPDESLFVSPGSEAPTLRVKEGYPDSVEKMSNGVYSILNKFGVAIQPADTVVNREDKFIQVIPKTPGEGIYYLRISAKETEHILTFDNTTSFNDIVYDPLLNVRQERLEFTGTRTLGWFGKMEAGGYLVRNSRLVQNFDNIVESIRYYYDSDKPLDNPEIDAGARHLIGYVNREFLDQLDVSDDVQFNFYQGFIRQKGTANAITKLLRSDEIQDKDEISFFEEWAIKMGEYGGTAENLSVEFVSKFDDVRTDPQIYRLDHKHSDEGVIKKIVIFNAEELYNEPPEILVSLPYTINPLIYDPENPPEPTYSNKIAKAVIDRTTRKLIRIDVVDNSHVYTVAPSVLIVPKTDAVSGSSTFATTARSVTYNSNLTNNDKAYAVLQMDIITDEQLDTIIDIDIDDNVNWIYYPPEYSVPLTNKSWTSYETPNAGYVHLDDVDYIAFDDDALHVLWEEETPTNGDTLWVAKTSQEKWGVYIVKPADNTYKLEADVNGVISFTVNSSAFGGDTVLQNANIWYNSSFTIPPATVSPQTPFVGVKGVVNIKLPDGKNTLYHFAGSLNETATAYVYHLINRDGTVVNLDEEFSDIDLSAVEYSQLINLRYKTIDEIPPILTGPYFWIDEVLVTAGVPEHGTKWVVYESDKTVPHREQILLIDTQLYNNAYLRNRATNNFISYASICDPFKDVMLGQISQNITYRTSNDPARYNNASNPRLINTNLMFGDKQLGQLWWDQSTIRYLQYEQSPDLIKLADDPAKERTAVLEYNRTNWAKPFPGSVANVYEWTESIYPPADYNGTGAPRNTTDYVSIITQNNVTGMPQVKYYYWVNRAEDIPNNASRTLSARNVAALIMNPDFLLQPWYAPVQETGHSTSYIFGVTNPTLTNQNVNIEIDYKLRADANEVHMQWLLLDEGNRFSIVPDQHWDKMVDSLVGYTVELPKNDFPHGVSVSDNTVVLPVPAYNLSEQQRLGIGIRPQQTMFRDIRAARKIMTQSVNSLMTTIRIWADRFDGWDNNITSNQFWGYVDWFLPGYNADNTIAKLQVNDYDQLYKLVNKVPDGQLVKVFPFMPDVNDKYEIHQYVAEIEAFVLVRKEDGTIAFKDTVFSEIYSSTLRREIRELLTALKENVFIGDFKVYENLVFFAMMNYTFSEQDGVDWAFKTSYISFIQDNIVLKQNPIFRSDLLTEFLNYIQEAKPFRTKVRETTTIIATAIDTAEGTAYDDAMGDFACVPLPVPFPDPVYPGEIVTETCTWINDSITETLRNFKLTVDFSRTNCSNPSAVCKQQIIDAGPFVLGWDAFYNTESFLMGWNTVTHLPGTTFIFLYFGWDDTAWDDVNFPINVIKYPDEGVVNTSNVMIDAEDFIYPYASPEELVPLDPVESIVMLSTYDNVIEPADESQTAIDTAERHSVGFRINLNPMTWVEYVRVSDKFTTRLAVDLTPDSTIIQLTDASMFSQPESGIANVIWVDAKTELIDDNGNPVLDDQGNVVTVSWGSERIEYRGKTGNTLFDITRGTMGTTIVAFASATVSKVSDGNMSQYIVRPDNVTVSNQGIILASGEILPGSVTLTANNYYPPTVEGDPIIVESSNIQVPNVDPWFKLYKANSGLPEDNALIASTEQARFLFNLPYDNN